MFRQNYLCTIKYYLNLTKPTKILILLWPRILTTKEGNMDEFVVSYDHKVVVFEEEKSPFMRPVWVAGGQLVPEQIFYSIQISPIVIKYHHFLLYFKYFPPLSNTILHYPVLSNTIQYYPMLSKITIIMLNYPIHPMGPVTIIRYDHRNIMNIHSTSCTENHCKSVQNTIIYKESNLV